MCRGDDQGIGSFQNTLLACQRLAARLKHPVQQLSKAEMEEDASIHATPEHRAAPPSAQCGWSSTTTLERNHCYSSLSPRRMRHLPNTPTVLRSFLRSLLTLALPPMLTLSAHAQGVNVLHSPKDANAKIMSAVKSDNKRLAGELLKAGVDPNAVGKPPLVDIALCKASTDMVRLLMKFGAKLDRNGSSVVRLLGCQRQHRDRYAFLYKNGARYSDSKILRLASQRRVPLTTIRWLIEGFKVPCNIFDQHLKKPIHYERRAKVIEYYMSAGCH